MMCLRFNTVGAFHTAIEVRTLSIPSGILVRAVVGMKVYGEEWAFYRTPNPTSCGVCAAGLLDVLVRMSALAWRCWQAKVFDPDTTLYMSTGRALADAGDTGI